MPAIRKVTISSRLLRRLLAACFMVPLPVSAEPRLPDGTIVWTMAAAKGRTFKMPRIVRFAKHSTMESVNRQLDAVAATFNCGPDAPREADGALMDFRNLSYAVHLRVSYDHSSVLSITGTTDSSCGGPYPNADAPFSVTFDMETGEAVAFEDLFRDYATNSAQILETIYQEPLREAAKHRDEPDDGSCKAAFTPDLLYGESAYHGHHFAFTNSGLAVQPDWPHVIAACATRVTLPYERLEPFARPGGILDRVIKARR